MTGQTPNSMSAATIGQPEAANAVLLAGVGTFVCAVTAVVALMTYQGVGLIGYRCAGFTALGVVLSVATGVIFLVRIRGGTTAPRAAAGLTLAIAAFPSAFALGFVAEALLALLGVSQ